MTQKYQISTRQMKLPTVLLITNTQWFPPGEFRLVNHIGQVNGQTNHKFITDLILNNWNYIRTHGPLLQNLHIITKEHNNWISKLF